jgi:pyruvate dehydrogenase E2 component (dihydrolipoamide acetyltransferase)
MARVDVVMPKMGESVMEGTVLEWKKGVGDVVELDETLLEISTDKVDSEVPSPSAGRIAEILVPEGETVEVGASIAVIETDVDAEVGGGTSGDGGDAEEAMTEASPEPEAKDAEPNVRPREGAEAQEAGASAGAGGGGSASSEPTSGGSAVGGAAVSGGQRVEVVMPKMGESVMEGTILTWHKAVGDEVELDETLLEISTDKVDSEVPSPAAGILAEILVPEGETVDVGAPIAVVATGADVSVGAPSGGAPAQQAPSGDSGEGEAPAPAEKSYGMAGPALQGDGAPLAEPAEAQVPSGDSGAGGDGASGPLPRRSESGRFYSPLVRSIAEQEGVSLQELEGIQGSGAEGRVTKKDLVGYLETRRQRPAAPAQRAPERPAQQQAPRPQARPAAEPSEAGDRVEVIQMDRMRQLISEHMRRSKDTSAHVTSFTEIDVTNLVRLREAQKKTFEAREGVKLTYTPFFVRAAVEALRTHPLLNASVEGNRILVKKDYHIGIAVAIGTKGLLVPAVRDAGQKNLAGLAHAISDLAERARNKQLMPDELQGGTFTVTNVGSLGSLMGTPIINQPQVAILSPGKIQKRPVVIEHPDLGDTIAIRHMMFVSLSYDHRIIDGSMGASFLQAYTRALESLEPHEAL